MSKTYVDRVHLLVHPGFGTFVDGTVDSSAVSDKHVALFDKYIHRAKRIEERSRDTRSEIMAVFHIRPESHMEDSTYAEAYTMQRYKEIQDILGDRVLFESDVLMKTVDADRSVHGPKFDAVRSKARQAGYVFRKDVVTTEAFGETIMKCVPAAAHNFNTYFNLKKRTIVRADLTNYSQYEEADMLIKLQQLTALQDKYKRIAFDCIVNPIIEKFIDKL